MKKILSAILVAALLCSVLALSLALSVFAASTEARLNVKEINGESTAVYVNGKYVGNAPYSAQIQKGATVKLVCSDDGFIGFFDERFSTLGESSEYTFEFDTDTTVYAFSENTDPAKVMLIYRNTNDTKQILAYSTYSDISNMGSEHLVSSASLFGYEFQGWDKTVAEIKASTDRTIIVSPAYDLTQETCVVSVENGTVNGSTGSVTLTEGTSVTLSANAAEDGDKFLCWIDSTGDVISAQSEFTMQALFTDTYKAIFIAEDLSLEIGVSTSAQARYMAGVDRFEIFTQRMVPDGVEVKGNGLLYAKDTTLGESEMILENVDGATLKKLAHTTSGATGYTKNTTTCEEYICLRPYITCVIDGETVTVYGDLLVLSKPHVYVDGVEAGKAPAKGNYVVYVKGNDDTKWHDWDYNAWAVSNYNKYEIYDLYFFSVSKLYDSFAAMKADVSSLSYYENVGIKSYYAGKNSGAAVFYVNHYVADATSLGSSKYAQLVPFTVGDQKIVTPEQFGAWGDGVSADGNAINSAFKYSRANTVEFESQTYLQTKKIELSRGDVTINGNGAAIHNLYNDAYNQGPTTEGDYSTDPYVVNEDFHIFSGDDGVYLSNITIKNLELNCSEERAQGVLYRNADHYQFLAKYTKNLTVENCRFINPEIENPDSERHVTSVVINNGVGLNLIDNVVLNYSNSTKYSGGIWLTGDTNFEYITTDMTIKGNYVEKTGHDEVLAIFGGAFDGVVIEDNIIYTHDEPLDVQVSAHAVGFGVWDVPTTVKNATFTGNVLDVVASNDAIMFSCVENVEICNNDITVRANSASQPVTYSVFRVTYIEENYENAGITVTQNNVNIYNNKISAYNNYNEIPVTESCDEGFNVHDNILSGDIIMPTETVNVADQTVASNEKSDYTLDYSTAEKSKNIIIKATIATPSTNAEAHQTLLSINGTTVVLFDRWGNVGKAASGPMSGAANRSIDFVITVNAQNGTATVHAERIKYDGTLQTGEWTVNISAAEQLTVTFGSATHYSFSVTGITVEYTPAD